MIAAIRRLLARQHPVLDDRAAWVASIQEQVRPRMSDPDLAVALERIHAARRLARQLDEVARQLAELSRVVGEISAAAILLQEDAS